METEFVLSTERILLAFGFTLFAGLATGVGSLMGLLSKRFNPTFLSLSLGFSAGVMIYVSFVEIFVKARDSLGAAWGESTGYWLTVLAFFIGIGVIALIDRLVPSGGNPHELKNMKPETFDCVGQCDSSSGTLGKGGLHGGGAEQGALGSRKSRSKLMRMGLFSALAIAIHNFPEGLATFMAALSDPALGFSIAIAIAIHNIPEGIAVSVPIFYATKSRKKAFWFSFLSGLAEPVGALVGFLLLRPFINDTTFGLVFAFVAGIMVYISLDELLPTAEEYGKHHVVIGGLIAGMGVMAMSLLLFT